MDVFGGRRIRTKNHSCCFFREAGWDVWCLNEEAGMSEMANTAETSETSRERVVGERVGDIPDLLSPAL